MMFEVVRTLHEDDIKDDFVALAVQVTTQGDPWHSGFVISYNGEIYFYHFEVPGIKFETLTLEDCFHKITDVIDERLIPSFIVMCKRVLKTANPEYGYFYSGEYYDEYGNHFSKSKMDQIMTCTGFCLNILKGFKGVDYVKYKDWQTPDYPYPEYVNVYADINNLNVDDIIEFHRRVSPLEILCSAYFKDLPISKLQIDTKSDEVETYLKGYSESLS